MDTGLNAAVVVLLLAALLDVVSCWDNEYDMPLRKECPAGTAFNRITSQHDSHKEDRRWSFQCSGRLWDGGVRCEWHNMVNTYDGILDFTCPAGHVISGVGSVHDSHTEDRVWDYWCCRPEPAGSCDAKNMVLTSFINDYDQYMSFSTSDVIVGFYSIHDSHTEDRRWKVRTAELECGKTCSCSVAVDGQWEIIDVTYDLEQFDLGDEEDVTIATRIINNPSTATAHSEFSVSETITETSSYRHSVGVTITTGVTFRAMIPLIAESEKSLSLSTSYSQTWGEDLSVSRQVTSSFSVTVPPFGRVRAKGIISRSTIDTVPYTMILRHKTLGCQCTSEGTWDGVQHHNLHLTVEDLNKQTSSTQKTPIVGSGAAVPKTSALCIGITSWLSLLFCIIKN